MVYKVHLDAEISKVKGHVYYTEKEYIEFEDVERSIKQSDNETFFEKAVKTTIRILNDEGFFVNYENAS